jgi:hypothetical protein
MLARPIGAPGAELELLDAIARRLGHCEACRFEGEKIHAGVMMRVRPTSEARRTHG